MLGAAKSLRRHLVSSRPLAIRLDSRRIFAGAVLLVLCLISILAGRAHAETTGITITPADIVLELPVGEKQTTTSFVVTNHYATPVQLSFAFEPRLETPNMSAIINRLHSSQTVVEVAAGQTVTQSITLHDDAQLSPGSHTADIVVTQSNSTAQQVGVASSIRIPLTAVKQDGATQQLLLAGFSAPRFVWSMPNSIQTSLRNSGNVIGIPRGFISITAPNGETVGKGTLNVPSTAIAPNTLLTLDTQLTKLTSARWPGIYTLELHYGLAGQTQAKTIRFLYATWWHALAAIICMLAVIWGVRRMRRPAQITLSPPIPKAKKALLIGRDIS